MANGDSQQPYRQDANNAKWIDSTLNRQDAKDAKRLDATLNRQDAKHAKNS